MVSVTTVYLGAAPEVVETSVTQVLEDQLIGIEGIKHVTSLSREQVSSISVEFELYRDVDAAAADVRDRVARARSTLPQDVEEPVIAKRSADARPIQWIALYGGGLSQIELSTLAETRLRDRLAKLPGVADVWLAGERRYAMRDLDRQHPAHRPGAHDRGRGRGAAAARTSTSRRAASRATTASSPCARRAR